MISGDHFSVLYPRSLGIFYHSLLDSRTALDKNDWQNRQEIYLKTTAYLLQVYDQSERLSTTVVPVGPRSVALLNFWAPPSDTLYSILYALAYLQDKQEFSDTYPFEASTDYSLHTAQAALQLQTISSQKLKTHYDRYLRQVYDPDTGLVKKNLRLSSTKDTAKRKSAFYDNVILWKTAALAQELSIIEDNEDFLDELKTKIIAEFWDEEEGIFIEDLSERSIEESLYSSDWLIVYMTGFLDPENPEETKYFTSSLDYIRRNALNQPFALQYHADRRPWQTYLTVNLLSRNYASTTIWSNWGMEYTKLLIHISQITGEEEYLLEAGRQLDAYAYNIKRYRGYPEVYDENGDFFRTFFYKSIRRTGWVVSFEQAREMHRWTDENWDSFKQ